MRMVLLTALGVGGSTVVGALLGFMFRKIPHKWNDIILSFAAGVMLCAAITGLIFPAVEQTGLRGIWQVVLGVLAGAAFLNLMDRLVPHLHHLSGLDREAHTHNGSVDKVLLFVLAIAIHNLPLGIMAQNIPEGMVVISPMLLAGISRPRTLLIAMFTGLIEVVGTLIGYAAGTASALVLPFLLAFAGGTMLYVICDEMIPETHSHGFERPASYALLVGFLLMLVLSVAMG